LGNKETGDLKILELEELLALLLQLFLEERPILSRPTALRRHFSVDEFSDENAFLLA